MGKVLSQQQIQAYQEEGFISPIYVMSEDEALSYSTLCPQGQSNTLHKITGHQCAATVHKKDIAI